MPGQWQATGPDGEFLRDLVVVFRLCQELLAKPDPNLLQLQTVCLRHFSGVFPAVSSVFSAVQISELLANFALSVRYPEDAPGLGKEKLGFFQAVVSSSLFASEAGRTYAMPAFLSVLQDHVRRRDQVELALKVGKRVCVVPVCVCVCVCVYVCDSDRVFEYAYRKRGSWRILRVSTWG